MKIKKCPNLIDLRPIDERRAGNLGRLSDTGISMLGDDDNIIWEALRFILPTENDFIEIASMRKQLKR